MLHAPDGNLSCLGGFTKLQMVAGRFVNVYSMNDWILGIAFRARLVHSRYLRSLCDFMSPFTNKNTNYYDSAC